MAKKRSFKEMRLVASQLPIQWKDGKMYMKGDEYLKRSGNSLTKDGKPIKEDQLYLVDTMSHVNHYKRIKKIFKTQGIDGVSKYVDEVIDLHAQASIQHENVLASIPMAPMSI